MSLIGSVLRPPDVIPAATLADIHAWKTREGALRCSANPRRSIIPIRRDHNLVTSRAAADYAALELPRNAGITTFSPVKPPRPVIASFEHGRGPHGLSYPHVRNIASPR